MLTGSGGSITSRFSFDAYGVLVGSQSSVLSPQPTSLLYSGEQFDSDLSQYYLRARYYDPSNGRFNRVDPFEGNNFDPQSLHKYAYAHGDPVNGVDPSGEFTLVELLWVIAIIAILFIIAAIAYLWALTKVKRGRTLYIDFDDFDLSEITLANGSRPNDVAVQDKIFSLATSEFAKGEIKLERGSKFLKPTVKYSDVTKVVRNSSGQLQAVIPGDERPGMRDPRVYLGTFSIPELQGKFKNDDELARAIALVTMHEGGHGFLLPHNPGADNIMTEDISFGMTGTTPIDKLLAGFLNPRTFTTGEITKLKEFNR